MRVHCAFIRAFIIKKRAFICAFIIKKRAFIIKKRAFITKNAFSQVVKTKTPSCNWILSTKIPEEQLEFLTYRYRVVLQLDFDCTFSQITTISENQMVRFHITKRAQEFYFLDTGPKPQIAFSFPDHFFKK